MTLTIRSTGDPTSLTAAVRHEVLGLDKDLPIFNVKTMQDVMAASTGSRRASVLLVSVFAGVALLLAAIGVYGVIAYTVTQRTRDIGLRMALGARAADVLFMIIGQGMRIALIGTGVGLIGALVITRVIGTLLFEVGVADPFTYAVVPLLLLSVTLIACWVPARRASRVDPIRALRAE
jgi:putative ABC transport system permease protein